MAIKVDSSKLKNEAIKIDDFELTLKKMTAVEKIDFIFKFEDSSKNGNVNYTKMISDFLLSLNDKIVGWNNFKVKDVFTQKEIEELGLKEQENEELEFDINHFENFLYNNLNFIFKFFEIYFKNVNETDNKKQAVKKK